VTEVYEFCGIFKTSDMQWHFSLYVLQNYPERHSSTARVTIFVFPTKELTRKRDKLFYCMRQNFWEDLRVINFPAVVLLQLVG
jgi:hypothetical protein